MLRRLLCHPLARELDLHSPDAAARHRAIILSKPFLRRIYGEWYRWLMTSVPGGSGVVVELGSGGGHLGELFPEVITSDVTRHQDIRMVMNGQDLPFRGDSLRGIVMTNVLHHLGRPAEFLREAARCVREGGVVSMIEPWCTPWSRAVYEHVHHEPMDPGADRWSSDLAGPMAGANTALPWIIFHRDRRRFDSEFPTWRVESLEPFMPFRYLLSGGVSMRCLVPGWSYPLWRRAEELMGPWMGRTAMFARITLRRRGSCAPVGDDDRPAGRDGMQ